jgi:DNA-binding transcriptional ArsR family regulator
MTGPSRAGRVREPHVLRALAHPLRNRLLALLRTAGPSTASRLGEQVGESSGVTSYHLRQLAQYGFVSEVEGRGTKRERWWQAEHATTTWEPDELVDQPGGLEANAEMQRLQVEVMGRELRAWLTAEQPREWAVVAGMSDYVLHLTPAQTREVLEELYAVLDRWAEQHREPAEGSAMVNLFTAAVPRVAP